MSQKSHTVSAPLSTSQKFWGSIFRFIANTARISSRMRVKGRANVPKTGPVLFVANHVCWADPIFLVVAFPRRVRFLILKRFYRKPIARFFSNVFGAIPISKTQPRTALDAAVEALDRGEAVCLFPEGTLTADGNLGEVKRGFEIIAQRSHCHVVAVAIKGLHGTAFAVRREWKPTDLFTRPWPRLVVEFGQPLSAEEATVALVSENLRNLLKT